MKYLYHVIIVLFLVISKGLLAQNVSKDRTFLNPESPLKAVDFGWSGTKNGEDLIIFFYFDTREIPDQNSIPIRNFKWKNVEGTIKLTSNTKEIEFQASEQEKLTTEGNEGIRFRLKAKNIEGISNLYSNSWKVIKLSLNYSVSFDSNSDTIKSVVKDFITHEIPFYSQKSSIGDPREISISALEFKQRPQDDRNEAYLKLKSNQENLLVEDIKIFNGEILVGKMKPFSEGNNLLGIAPSAVIEFNKDIVPDKTYNIEVFINENNQLKKIKIVGTLVSSPTFSISSLKIQGKENPKGQVFIEEDKNIAISVSLSFDSRAVNKDSVKVTASLKSIFSQKDTSNSKDDYFEGGDYKFNPSGNNATMSLPLKGKQDGIYSLIIQGSTRSINGEKIPLASRSFQIYKDTHNEVEGLRFINGKKNIELSFKLKNSVDADKVRAKIDNMLPPINAILASDGRYNISIPKETFNSKLDELAKVILIVDGENIFDFEFFILDDKKLGENMDLAISSYIDANNTNRNKVRRAIRNNDPEVIKELSDNMKGKIEGVMKSSERANSPSDKMAFEEELDEVLSTLIENWAHSVRNNNAGFWKSDGGKAIKFIGNVAIKFLGVLVV